MKQEIKQKIQQYSIEAEELANEIVNINSEKSRIEERLTQIVGAISALNSLLVAKSSQAPDDSPRNHTK